MILHDAERSKSVEMRDDVSVFLNGFLVRFLGKIPEGTFFKGSVSHRQKTSGCISGRKSLEDFPPRTSYVGADFSHIFYS